MEVVTFEMELAMTVEEYDEAAMIAELAAYYGVDPSLISLEATPITDRRRLASNGSAAGGSGNATGRLLFKVTILVPDEIEETEAGSQSGGASGGPTVSRVAVTAESFAGRLALLNSGDGNLLTLSAALGFNTTVGGGGVQIGTSTQQVQVSCPTGYWCSAANRIECVADTYQPKENQIDAGACLPCAEFSESLPASTAKSACKCVYGYYDADVDPAALPVCKPCPVGSDCKGEGNTLMLLPLEEGYFRVTKYDVDIRRCPDFGVDVGSACIGGSGKACGYVDITMCMCMLHVSLCAAPIYDSGGQRVALAETSLHTHIRLWRTDTTLPLPGVPGVRGVDVGAVLHAVQRLGRLALLLGEPLHALQGWAPSGPALEVWADRGRHGGPADHLEPL